MRKLIFAFSVFTLLLAACAGPAEVVEVTREVEVTRVVEVEAEGDLIELEVWDQFTEEAAGSVVEKVYADFEAAHPNVTIRRDITGTTILQGGLARTALAAGTGPDVLYLDIGPSEAGVLIEAGLILPLDDYAEQYDWNNRIFQWALDHGIYNGKLWGLGYEFEWYAMYYNKTLIEELGLQVPETDAELLAFCEDAKAQGFNSPLAWSNNPGWQSIHGMTFVGNSRLGSAEFYNVITGQSSWDSPEMLEAIQFFWVDLAQSCFPDDLNAITYDTQTEQFIAGEALINTTGTWFIKKFEEETQGEVGIAKFPGVGGMPPPVPAGIGSAWFINADSEYPDLAAELVNAMFAPDIVKLWVEDVGRWPPTFFDASEWSLSPLTKEGLQIITDAAAGVDGQTLGWATEGGIPPEVRTHFEEGFPLVLVGDKTPEEMIADLQGAQESATDILIPGT